MKQYILKSDIVAEIEKLQLCTMDEHMNFYSAEAQGEYNALSKLDSFLDTLEVKEVDLEKEIDNYIDTKEIWEIQEAPLTSIENAAIHFFELGLKAQKGE